MMDFSILKKAVAKQFDLMQKHDLFRVKIEKDQLWETYLASFSANDNPVYRERTEHDCACCKQFIRAIGDVVAIINGKVVSIWDVLTPSEPGYQTVANAMSGLVKSMPEVDDNGVPTGEIIPRPIANLFLHYEKTAGQDKNFEQLASGVKTWEHFFVNIPTQFVMPGANIASTLAEPRAAHDVLLRSLKELSDDSVDTVLELIAQRSLYRGEEHLFVLTAFNKLKKQFNKLKTDHDKDLFVWSIVKSTVGSVAKIRNTAIGTLLIDLTDGVDLEQAVKSFHAVMDPNNHHKPTALLVTKSMVEDAKKKIEILGLTSALKRRFATINDITINNILFANRDARSTITGDIFDELAATTKAKPKNLDKVEEISIERFISEILPRAESIEVMMDNSHTGNLVSLIAPDDPTAGNMFKWDNKFSWSYQGNLADSVKERVKAAGGSVVGDLCCRLAWDYRDDLDLHMIEPNGFEIDFTNRRTASRNGGMLDLDANGGDGPRDDPAENIFYKDRTKMADGVYTLKVKNYRRCSDGMGFTTEIEFDGQVHTINYDKVIPGGTTITIAKIKYSKAKGFEIIESLPSSQLSRTVWGIQTNTFQKVNVMMMSPNYWDEKGVGNKHYFFMIDRCVNDDSARGFLNEFLMESLKPHRKVMEIVGSKMKVDNSENQLSGLGFSSTQKNTLLCRVKGSFTRTIKIVF